MMNDDFKMKQGWHLDKKVPLSIILALIVQSIVLIVWAATLDNRVGVVEQNVTAHSVTLETMKNAQNTIAVGLARIEERQIIQGEGVKEIKARLDARQK